MDNKFCSIVVRMVNQGQWTWYEEPNQWLINTSVGVSCAFNPKTIGCKNIAETSENEWKLGKESWYGWQIPLTKAKAHMESQLCKSRFSKPLNLGQFVFKVHWMWDNNHWNLNAISFTTLFFGIVPRFLSEVWKFKLRECETHTIYDFEYVSIWVLWYGCILSLNRLIKKAINYFATSNDMTQKFHGAYTN